MATNVKTGDMQFPYSLGKVYPGASFATVSAALTQNIVPVNNDGVTRDRMFNGIAIQAHPDNGDDLYICNSASAPDTTNYTNILAVLSPGAWYGRGKEWANNRNISTLFVGAKNQNDFAIVSIDQF